MRVVRAVLSGVRQAGKRLRLDDEPARVERSMDFAVGKDHTSNGLLLRPGFQLIDVNGDVLAVLKGRSRQVQEGLRAFPLNQLNSNPPGNWAIEGWGLRTVDQFLRHEQGDLAPIRLANHNSIFDAELPRINPA